MLKKQGFTQTYLVDFLRKFLYNIITNTRIRTMQISIKGGSKTQKKYAKDIIRFCGAKLMSKRLAKSLNIKVHFVKGLLDKYNQAGNCMWEDDSYRPKEFLLEIDADLKLRRVLQSVCHEMVHVKQFAKGEMRDLAGAERVSYNGKRYELDKDDYFERPWEIEAHGRELGLFVRWAEANQLGHLKWTQENERG